MKTTLIVLITCTLLISGCSQRMLNFTIVSTKNFDYTRGASFTKAKERSEAQDLAHIIVFVPHKEITLNQAIDNAIEAIPNCVAILDGVIYYKWWYVPYIYGQQSYVIKGTPLLDGGQMGQTQNGPSFYKIEVDKDGKGFKSSSISSETFYALEAKLAPAAKTASLGTVSLSQH